MKVLVLSHDQGVDGGCAIAVFASKEGVLSFMEKEILPHYPKLRKEADRLFWDSLGDSFLAEEMDVRK